jgi:hypothetical protein
LSSKNRIVSVATRFVNVVLLMTKAMTSLVKIKNEYPAIREDGKWGLRPNIEFTFCNHLARSQPDPYRPQSGPALLNDTHSVNATNTSHNNMTMQ